MADSSRPCKRFRGPNFGESEIFSLLQDVLLHKNTLFGLEKKSNKRVSVHSRYEVWNSIADKLTVIGGQERTGSQVKTKWKDLAKIGRTALAKRKEAGYKKQRVRPYMSLVFTILAELGKIRSESRNGTEMDTGEGNQSDYEMYSQELAELQRQDDSSSSSLQQPLGPAKLQGMTTTNTATGSSSQPPIMVLTFDLPPDMADLLGEETKANQQSTSQQPSSQHQPESQHQQQLQPSSSSSSSLSSSTTTGQPPANLSQVAASSTSSLLSKAAAAPPPAPLSAGNPQSHHTLPLQQQPSTASSHSLPSASQPIRKLELADSSQSLLGESLPGDALKMQLLRNQAKQSRLRSEAEVGLPDGAQDQDSLWREWLRSEIALSHLRQQKLKSKLELCELQKRHLQMQLDAMDSEKTKVHDRGDDDSSQ